MLVKAAKMSLLHKLKEGIQDAVVFLHALERFQIPAVMERRRRVLLKKLESLQVEPKSTTLPRQKVQKTDSEAVEVSILSDKEREKEQEEKTKKRASSVGTLGGFLKRARKKEKKKTENSDTLEQESKAEEGVPMDEPQKEDGAEEKVDGQKKQRGGNKRQSFVPEQGIQKNGYVYRKGRKKWEKCYCVLSYSALYFTTASDSKEYTHVLHIVDQKSSVKREKKGHEKNAHSLLIKAGGKKEQLSLESSVDCDSWHQTLQQVMSLSGIKELISEDEDTEEELYEDVPPPLPVSPRPPHKPKVPTETSTNVQDSCDEDIYEEFDDIRQQDSLSSSFSASPPPSLPPRNLLVPKLPPRNSTPSPPAGRTLKKSPAEAPPTSSPSENDEELYSDIALGQDREGEEDEDLYVDNGVNSPVDEPYDEDMADEDLYEDFNDKRQENSPQNHFSASPPISLPPRTETVPKLPPRNVPTSPPALPPRVLPQKDSVKVPPRSPPTEINEEQQSDTAPEQEDEEEDLYVDNVVTPPKVDEVEKSRNVEGQTSEKVPKSPLRRKPVRRNKGASLLDVKQEKQFQPTSKPDANAMRPRIPPVRLTPPNRA